MRSTKPMRVAKTGYIVISAALFVLGFLLLLDPAMSLAVFNTIFGVALIAFGIIKLVGYFSKDLYRLAFQFDMATGILLIALGVLALVFPNATGSLFCIVIGILFLTDGLLRIQIALDAKRFGISKWWLVFALAVLTAAAGLLLIVCVRSASQIVMVLAGLALICEGGLTLGVALTTVKIVVHQRPEDEDTFEAESWKIS